MEWRCLALGHFMHLAKHFRGGCLIKSHILGKTRFADCLQQANGAEPRHIAGIFRNIKGNPDVTLGSQIIDLIGAQIVKELGHLRRIRQIAVVQEKLGPVDMGI